MRDTQARDASAVFGPLQPSWKFSPDATAEHSTTLHPQSLAGHDEHDPQAALGGVGQEIRDRPLSRSQSHAMKVEARLGPALAPRQRTIDIAVEGLEPRQQGFRR